MPSSLPKTRDDEAERDARYRSLRRVTLLGTLIDALLSLVKVVVGYLAHSQALLADGVHSLSDLATDVLILFAAKHAHRAADESHPYGHGRIETLMTVALGLILLLVALGIAWDAVDRMLHPVWLLHPGLLALVVAALSVGVKEWCYRFTLRTADRVRSDMLRANAWHHRSDAISSVVVMVGVGGSLAGLPYLDAVAAVAVALLIARIAWQLIGESVRELIDTAPEPDKVRHIRERILDVHGVRSMHMLRTRKSGGDVLVDVHLLVDPTVSVSEGHQIGERVRRTLMESLDDVHDVTVHIDPEDDEKVPANQDLPLRNELQGVLERIWSDVPEAARIEDLTLHYLDGKVHVDLVLPLDSVRDRDDARRLEAQFRDRVRDLPDIGAVRVFFH